MRIVALRSVALGFCILLGIIVVASSDQADATEPRAVLRASTRDFVARLISLESGSTSSFVAHLRECYLPVWRELHCAEALSSVSVFELTHYDSTKASPSVHDYLVLVELGPGRKPSNLMDAEAASSCGNRQDIPGFSVIRSAHMSCTPNSCYGFPEPAAETSGAPLHYLVEFIGVEDTAAVLAKYRELVSKYFGPANGVLVESGMLHCFVALENTEVLSDSPGAVPWNQIHMSDDLDAGGDVNWDSVYVELFRNEFSCELDSVWAEVPPTDETRTDYHGRLIPDLCVR